MWAGRLISPLPMAPSSNLTPLYTIFYKLLSGLPFVATLVAFLLNLAAGALINNLLYERHLLQYNTLLPMFIYIVTTSMIPQGQTLNPMFFVNILIIWMFYYLICTDTKFKLTSKQILDSALLLSISTLLYFPAITLAVPFLIIFIIIYRLYNVKDIVSLLLGFFAPYVVIFTYTFMTDQTLSYLKSMGYLLSHPILINGTGSTIQLVLYSFFILFLLYGIIYLLNYSRNQTIIFRNNATIVSIILVSSISLVFFCPHFSIETQAFAIPFAFIANLWIFGKHIKPWIPNAILTVWTLLSILCCYLPF